MTAAARVTAAPQALPAAHLLLALAVVAVWGTNFVVIRIGLDALPPLTFATLRFAFAFLPAAFLIPRPAVAWRSLAALRDLRAELRAAVIHEAVPRRRRFLRTTYAVMLWPDRARLP